MVWNTVINGKSQSLLSDFFFLESGRLYTGYPQRANGKGKKPFQSQLVNSQRIGITLKLEAKKKIIVQGQRRVLLKYSENEIIHILMYFIETRQVGLEQESAKYGKATTERTNFKQDPLQHLPYLLE